MRFDFVRTELVHVTGEQRQAYVCRLLGEIVAPGGGGCERRAESCRD